MNLNRLTASEREAYLYATDPDSPAYQAAVLEIDAEIREDEHITELEELENQADRHEMRADDLKHRIDNGRRAIDNMIATVGDDEQKITRSSIIEALECIDQLLAD